MATDVFGKKVNAVTAPVTADNAILDWGGVVSAATNVAINYGRGITRHRSIGNQKAVMVATQPQGSISISRIVTDDEEAIGLFSKPGWDGCIPGEISLTLNGCSGTSSDAAGNAVVVTAGSPIKFTAIGCLVSSFSIQAEAEGLMVVDNVTIDFLQLLRN